MKKVILFSFAMLAMATVSVAQNTIEASESKTTISEDGAQIEFISETIDYGTIETYLATEYHIKS